MNIGKRHPGHNRLPTVGDDGGCTSSTQLSQPQVQSSDTSGTGTCVSRSRDDLDLALSQQGSLLLRIRCRLGAEWHRNKRWLAQIALSCACSFGWPRWWCCIWCPNNRRVNPRRLFNQISALIRSRQQF